MLAIVIFLAMCVGFAGMFMLIASTDPLQVLSLDERARTKQIGNALLAVAILVLFICVSFANKGNPSLIYKQQQTIG